MSPDGEGPELAGDGIARGGGLRRDSFEPPRSLKTKRCGSIVHMDRIYHCTGDQRWLALGMAQPNPDAAIVTVGARMPRGGNREEIIRIISAREVGRRPRGKPQGAHQNFHLIHRRSA